MAKVITSQMVDDSLVHAFSKRGDRDQLCIALYQIFLTYSPTFNLASYDGRELCKFIKLLEEVKFALNRLHGMGLDTIIGLLVRNRRPSAELISPSLHPLNVFFKALVMMWVDDRTLTAEEYRAKVDLWKRQVNDALRVFNSRDTVINVSLDGLDMDFLRNKIISIKTLFTDDPVKKAFIQNMVDIKRKNQDVYPFGVICGPSGSGKTTFALHMCCGDAPVIYGLFNFDMKAGRLEKPFHGISNLLVSTAMEDVNMIKNLDVSKKLAIIWASEHLFQCGKMRALGNDPSIKYSYVGLIVALFEELERKRIDEPTLDWAELQCSIGVIKYSPLAISEGSQRLAPIKTKYPDMPLLMFLDAASLKPSLHEAKMSSNNIEDADSLVKRFLLMRNIARILQIVVVFSGTDAQITDIEFTPPLSFLSGDDYEASPPHWAFIMNILPSFDKLLLERRCDALLQKFRDHPRLSAIVRFVRSVSQSELPWFIELCLQGLEQLKDNVVAEADAMNTLSLLVHNCSNHLISSGRLEGDVSFNKGQFRYINNYSWFDKALVKEKGRFNICKANLGDAQYINDHLGHLYGYTDAPDSPIVTLKLMSSDRVYSGYRDNAMFVPKSVFPTFRDAPITGLTLFGLYSDHEYTFISNSAKRVTVQSAFLSIITPRKGRKPSKVHTPLQELFDCAAIIASHANGVGGCNVLQFLGSLVRELSPYFDDAPIVTCNDSILALARRIPFLSPMVMSGWNDDLLVLLSALQPADEPPRVGLYQTSNSNGSIAYYYDPSEPFQTELSQDLHEKVMGEFGEPFPGPVKGYPKHGKMTRIDRFPSEVAFAAVCQQFNKPMTVTEVTDIVANTAADLVFIVAYNFVSMTDLAVDNVVFWCLERTETEYRLAQCGLPITGTFGRPKQVILVPVDIIWGNQSASKIKRKLYNTCIY